MKSSISIFLASLILVSTVGITISKHFCGSEMASTTAEVKSCVCSSVGSGCGTTEDSDGCCDTEKSFFQTDYDYAGPSTESLTIAQASVLSIVVYHLALDFSNAEGVVYFRSYKPPIPDKDIPVLFQSFLI